MTETAEGIFHRLGLQPQRLVAHRLRPLRTFSVFIIGCICERGSQALITEASREAGSLLRVSGLRGVADHRHE